MLNISDKCLDNSEAVRKYHKKIRVASEYLLSLINDVLDMSKLDSGEMYFAEESVYLREMLENCRDIMETRAAEHGIELETPGLVENGKQVVEAFKESDWDEYDCILMDVMMPIMDGYTATRRIRGLSRPDAQSIPIIALTANAFAEDRKKAMEAGMNDHVAKPVDMKVLTAVLQKYLEK